MCLSDKHLCYANLSLGEDVPPWYVSEDTTEVTQAILFPTQMGPKIVFIHYPDRYEEVDMRNSSQDRCPSPRNLLFSSVSPRRH